MRFLTLLLTFVGLTTIAQPPDVIHNNGYVFSKQWTNDFTNNQSDWFVANWTFDENLCEFSDIGINLNQDDGELTFSILPKTISNMGDYPEKPYWGGEYWTSEKYLYGRYEIEMKPNTPSGVVTSFFLMDITWNDDYSEALSWAEIDIEFAGTNDAVQFTIHWIDEQGNKQMDANTVPLSRNVTDQFYTWTIEWTPTYISYYLEDNLMFSFTDPDLLATQAYPQEIHLNHWVSSSPEWVGVFNEDNMPVETQYKKITYYQFDGEVVNTNKLKKDTEPLVVFDAVNKKVVIKNHEAFQKLMVHDTSGKLVLQKNITKSIYSVEQLKPGIYILTLQKDGKKQATKLVIK